MVQLKGEVGEDGDNDTDISIPHGTIKRGRQDFHQPGFAISIPHGTIKRNLVMMYEVSCLISIPHGTIKSKPMMP